MRGQSRTIFQEKFQFWLPHALEIKSTSIVCLFENCFSHFGACLIAQLVKNPPAMQETWVCSLGWEIPWRRESLPTLVFWPGEFHGLYCPWFTKLRTRLSNFHFQLFRPNNLLPSPNSKYFSQSCNRALTCDCVKW